MNMFNPPHPGIILGEDCIKPLGLTIKEAAFKMGITRQNLSDIVNGKTAISPVMALKIAKAFNSNAEFWLNMQMKYDLWQAMQKTSLDDVQVIAM
ncbi:MAG: HigA family addiction module antitoxin [Candidatus Gastranaerophilales bacterium]|nr:HigA family addiction module antitoxin [Candidatus Gastranaerophilales bacterium]